MDIVRQTISFMFYPSMGDSYACLLNFTMVGLALKLYKGADITNRTVVEITGGLMPNGRSLED